MRKYLGVDKKNCFAVFFVVFFIFADQFIKYLVRLKDTPYICNTGIAFGIKVSNNFLVIFYCSLFLVFLAFLMSKKRLFLFSFSFLLISSGAISNSIDRLRFGCVIDYIDLRFWPVFNLADVFITIGAIMILLETIKLTSLRTYALDEKLRD